MSVFLARIIDQPSNHLISISPGHFSPVKYGGEKSQACGRSSVNSHPVLLINSLGDVGDSDQRQLRRGMETHRQQVQRDEVRQQRGSNDADPAIYQLDSSARSRPRLISPASEVGAKCHLITIHSILTWKVNYRHCRASKT